MLVLELSLPTRIKHNDSIYELIWQVGQYAIYQASTDQTSGADTTDIPNVIVTNIYLLEDYE